VIRLEKEDGLWIVTLDRPQKANSLTTEMLEELCAVADAAAEARVLVLTGAGSVFSAGADLEAAKAGLATSPLWERLSAALARLDGLTIAALNGTVAGGALGMVLACDLRVAVPEAKVFYPVMKLGFRPQPSDPGRLIGPARAKMILMAGHKVQAKEAAGWGLIDRVVEDDVMAEARVLAHDVLAATPQHAASIKRMIG
jgi:enoyl-CoA hydratase/carnithine racemase